MGTKGDISTLPKGDISKLPLQVFYFNWKKYRIYVQ